MEYGQEMLFETAKASTLEIAMAIFKIKHLWKNIFLNFFL